MTIQGFNAKIRNAKINHNVRRAELVGSVDKLRLNEDTETLRNELALVGWEGWG